MLGRIEGFGDQGPDPAVGPVRVILAVLVLDDILLDPELGVVERAQQVAIRSDSIAIARSAWAAGRSTK